jgi:hypothetical protein
MIFKPFSTYSVISLLTRKSGLVQLDHRKLILITNHKSYQSYDLYQRTKKYMARQFDLQTFYFIYLMAIAGHVGKSLTVARNHFSYFVVVKTEETIRSAQMTY